ncbi:hypothetical protein, partial [Klebsiella variicola]|uniref:hypothetical protein n=1 Tax=Klebsiella variicola TaxID=244366 RepID=UPI001C6609E6
FRPHAVITWSDDHPNPDHRMTAKIAFDAVTLARIPKILNEAGTSAAALSPAPDLGGDAAPESGEDIRRLAAWRDPI